MAPSMTQIGNYGEDLPEAGRARRLLAGFRSQVYRSLTGRADELFELADAVLCADGPVRDLAGLSLAAGHRRGHGAVYDALNAGGVDIGRLRWAVGCVPLPAWPDGRIRLAVDVCNWLRPEAATSAERMFCHVHGRGRNAGQMIPGWPYSVVAALGPGATSWTAPLDAVRLGRGACRAPAGWAPTRTWSQVCATPAGGPQTKSSLRTGQQAQEHCCGALLSSRPRRLSHRPSPGVVSVLRALASCLSGVRLLSRSSSLPLLR